MQKLLFMKGAGSNVSTSGFLDWIILEMKEKRESLSLLWLIECCRFTVNDYDKHQKFQME